MLIPVQADGQHPKTHFLLQLYEGTVVIGIKLQSCYQVEPTISVPKDGERNWTLRSVSSLTCGGFIRRLTERVFVGHDPWTDPEDLKLLEALANHGKRWNIISGCIKGRPAVQCRNRFISLRRAGKVSEDGKSSMSAIVGHSPTLDTETTKARVIVRHTQMGTFH